MSAFFTSNHSAAPRAAGPSVVYDQLPALPPHPTVSLSEDDEVDLDADLSSSRDYSAEDDEDVKPAVTSASPSAKGKAKAKADPPHKKARSTSSGAAGDASIKKERSAVDKKKKAGRACATCQKAHLTCDDARPCARCVKKGCPDQCHDGARKKAKYLQEIPDELLERRPPMATTISNGSLRQSGDDSAMPFNDATSMSTDLGSSSNPTHRHLDRSPVANSASFDGFSLPASFYPQTSTVDAASSAPDALGSHQSQQPDFTLDLAASNSLFGSEAANLEYAILSSMLSSHNYQPGIEPFPRPSTSSDMGLGRDTTNGWDASASATSRPAPPASSDAPPLQHQPLSNGTINNRRLEPGSSTANGNAGEEAYKSVTKPYPYAQSYHYLVRHLKERFEKNDILRIIRALATFRPSLIALQMPLTEEDETFVERTFQRTLVELHKLISFSGTPTVVWRRTGEVVLVGTEFCLLTGWKREELVGKKYIFELFDTASVVEYYESFARHAFESTSSSVSSQCVVLGPSGKPVPCAFCFTIRRDLFSCPFLIVGSFLPVLV